MNESVCFIRGQVWYWEDPIYGPKENNMNVSIGEATMRYNRYCIIAETNDSIKNNSVLVIPCSSSSNTMYDVPISLTHFFKDGYTYARVKEIFPVHPRYLQRYVCTISDKDMKLIEGTLAKILVPTIFNEFGNDGFYDLFGMSHENTTYNPVTTNADVLEINIRRFIHEHLVIGNPEDTISAYELKDAYDQFCIINNMQIDTDIVEFLDTFTKLTSNSSHEFINRSKYNIINIKGIRIIGDLSLSILLNEREIINPDDPQKLAKWNDSTIDDFLKAYEEFGIAHVCEKFDIKESTATNYWYKWKDRLEQKQHIQIVPKVPSTVDVKASISKISNFIRDDLCKKNLFYNPKIMKDNKIPVKDFHGLTASQFYKSIGNCIFYSLNELLSIKINGDIAHIPVISENNKYIDTWHFFDKAYHDKRISLCKNAEDTFMNYRKHFPTKDAISRDWLPILKKYLFKLNLRTKSIDIIISMIEELCCK